MAQGTLLAPLRTSGTDILDKRSRPVRLFGLNDVSLVPVDGWHPTPVKAVEDQVAWGFNTVRLAFTWENFEPTKPQEHPLVHTWNADYVAALKESVALYTDRGIGVILSPMQQHYWSDLPWAGQGGAVGQGFPHWMYPPSVSTLDLDQARYDFFADLPSGGVKLPGSPWFLMGEYEHHVASLFADNSLVIGINVFNEPFSYQGKVGEQDLVGLYSTVGQRIKEADPNALLFLEDSQYSLTRGFALRSLPALSGCVYSFHLYQPTAALARINVDANLAQAAKLRAPTWLGEYVGFHYMETGDWQALADHANLLSYLRTKDTSWSYYSYQGPPGGLVRAGSLITSPPAINQLQVLQGGM